MSENECSVLTKLSSHNHNHEFTENLISSFLQNDVFLDLIFICKGNIFVQTNKFIIASVSELITKIISASNQDVIYINLPDVDPVELHIVFSFLYEGVSKLTFLELVSLKDILKLLGIRLYNTEIKGLGNEGNSTAENNSQYSCDNKVIVQESIAAGNSSEDHVEVSNTSENEYQETENNDLAGNDSSSYSKGRTLWTKEQLLVLESVFNKDMYPSENDKKKLCRLWGVHNRQISGWFARRRFRQKKEGDVRSNTENVQYEQETEGSVDSMGEIDADDTNTDNEGEDSLNVYATFDNYAEKSEVVSFESSRNVENDSTSNSSKCITAVKQELEEIPNDMKSRADITYDIINKQFKVEDRDPLAICDTTKHADDAENSQPIPMNVNLQQKQIQLVANNRDEVNAMDTNYYMDDDQAVGESASTKLDNDDKKENIKDSKRFSKEQILVLEEIFKKDMYPSFTTRLKLADEFGVHWKYVYRWFNGKRNKLGKNKQPELNIDELVLPSSVSVTNMGDNSQQNSTLPTEEQLPYYTESSKDLMESSAMDGSMLGGDTVDSSMMEGGTESMMEGGTVVGNVIEGSMMGDIIMEGELPVVNEEEGGTVICESDSEYNVSQQKKEENGGRKKILTHELKVALEEAFKIDMYPSFAVREDISKKFGVSWKYIYNWFSGRRERAQKGKTSKSKNAWKKLTNKQINILENMFQRDMFPNTSVRSSLAQEFGVHSAQIFYWFDERLQSWLKAMGSSKPSGTSSAAADSDPYSTTVNAHEEQMPNYTESANNADLMDKEHHVDNEESIVISDSDNEDGGNKKEKVSNVTKKSKKMKNNEKLILEKAFRRYNYPNATLILHLSKMLGLHINKINSWFSARRKQKEMSMRITNPTYISNYTGFTEEQLLILEDTFKKNKYPSYADSVNLSKKFGIHWEHISKWFVSRRLKEREKKLSSTSTDEVQSAVSAIINTEAVTNDGSNTNVEEEKISEDAEGNENNIINCDEEESEYSVNDNESVAACESITEKADSSIQHIYQTDPENSAPQHEDENLQEGPVTRSQHKRAIPPKINMVSAESKQKSKKKKKNQYKPQHRFTCDDEQVLNEAFLRKKYPSYEEIVDLSRKLNADWEFVYKWFVSRRLTERTMRYLVTNTNTPQAVDANIIELSVSDVNINVSDEQNLKIGEGNEPIVNSNSNGVNTENYSGDNEEPIVVCDSDDEYADNTPTVNLYELLPGVSVMVNAQEVSDLNVSVNVEDGQILQVIDRNEENSIINSDEINKEQYNDVSSLVDCNATEHVDLTIPSETGMEVADSQFNGVEESVDPLAEESVDPLTEASHDPLAEGTNDSLAEEQHDPLAEESHDPLAEESHDPLAEESHDPLAMTESAEVNCISISDTDDDDKNGEERDLPSTSIEPQVLIPGDIEISCVKGNKVGSLKETSLNCEEDISGWKSGTSSPQSDEFSGQQIQTDVYSENLGKNLVSILKGTYVSAGVRILKKIMSPEKRKKRGRPPSDSLVGNVKKIRLGNGRSKPKRGRRKNNKSLGFGGESDIDSDSSLSENFEKSYVFSAVKKDKSMVWIYCSKCNKKFVNMHCLRAHSCEEYYKYKCSFCDASYRQIDYLFNHQKIHEKKIYKCNICNIRITEKKYLKSHVRQHLNFNTAFGNAAEKRWLSNSKLLVEEVIDDDNDTDTVESSSDILAKAFETTFGDMGDDVSGDSVLVNSSLSTTNISAKRTVEPFNSVNFEGTSQNVEAVRASDFEHSSPVISSVMSISSGETLHNDAADVNVPQSSGIYKVSKLPKIREISEEEKEILTKMRPILPKDGSKRRQIVPHRNITLQNLLSKDIIVPTVPVIDSLFSTIEEGTKSDHVSILNIESIQPHGIEINIAPGNIEQHSEHSDKEPLEICESGTEQAENYDVVHMDDTDSENTIKANDLTCSETISVEEKLMDSPEKSPRSTHMREAPCLLLERGVSSIDKSMCERVLLSLESLSNKVDQVSSAKTDVDSTNFSGIERENSTVEESVIKEEMCIKENIPSISSECPVDECVDLKVENESSV